MGDMLQPRRPTLFVALAYISQCLWLGRLRLKRYLANPSANSSSVCDHATLSKRTLDIATAYQGRNMLLRRSCKSCRAGSLAPSLFLPRSGSGRLIISFRPASNGIRASRLYEMLITLIRRLRFSRAAVVIDDHPRSARRRRSSPLKHQTLSDPVDRDLLFTLLNGINSRDPVYQRLGRSDR